MVPRKLNDVIQLSKIRIRESLRRKLARQAELKGTTLNGEIADRLEKTFEEEDRWEAMARDLEQQREAIDERQRAYYEEQALKEAQFEAALRDTKILNMMVANQRKSAKLLRLLAFELERSPRWGETSNARQMFANRVHDLILNYAFPPDDQAPKEPSE